MSNNDFSTNMGYNRKISSSGSTGAARVSPTSWNFDTDIDEYTRTNVNISKETITEEDSSVNLDMFLEPDNIETIEKANITDGLELEPTETKKGFFENLGDAIISAGATYVVGRTSVISGVADIGEGIVDGLTWTGGKVVEGASWLIGKVAGWFSDDAEEAVMDWREQAKTDVKEFIATDWVSEANELFYEGTELGRFINDASDMKYDSELAQGIRSVTEDVGVFAIATTLTVCTGGAAAPLTLSLGAAYGMGNAAEDTYATVGTDTSTIQELLILGNGALSALSWYSSGKLGKGFVEIGKSMAEAGVKEILAEMCKDIFSKEMLKELFKPSNVVGNAISTLMQTGGDIGRIATTLYNGGEVTAEEWALLVGELILYFGLNVAEDALRTEITEFKAPSNNIKTDAEGISTQTDLDDAKPIDTLDETGLDEAPTKTPDTETLTPTEKLNEPEILPEAKTPHPDDEYVNKALDILDPNTATKLSTEIGNLDDDALKKVLTAMTGPEIAAQLKDLDAKDMDRVINALSGNQLTDVVGELAERISKGELSSDILDKLDPSLRLEVLDRTDPFSLSDDYMRRRIMELENKAKKITDESQLDLIESELDSLNQTLVRNIHDLDNPSYEKYIQDVINKKIENAQWGGKTLDADELALVTKEAEEIAANTIANIERLKSDGIFKDGYSTEDIVKLIQSDIDPKTYLSAKGIQEWKVDFGIQGKGLDDTVTVYVFQDTSNPYCVANKKGKNYNGVLGRAGENGGAFVLSDTKIDKLVKEGIINPDGTVTDIAALNKELGANYTGPMVLIGVDTKVSDLQLPRGNNEGAYLGEWCPGGMTSGGTYEAVIPATNDYVIISDSRTITGG